MIVLDKKKCVMNTCNFSDISHIFEKFHYKGSHMGGGISACFALFIDGFLCGGAVLGRPRHEKKYKNCIDIRRMACIDTSPKNSESFFLGKIIRWITENTKYDFVLSYSDLTQGHNGTIYKASNFKEVGETQPTKYVEWRGIVYHPRSLSIDREYSYKMRKAIDTGEAKLITGLPKKIWIYEIKRKQRTEKQQKPKEQELTLF